MRLLHTFSSDRDARQFCAYLISQGINTELDIQQSKADWGSDQWGELLCHVWIIDEDDLQRAHVILEQYRENPKIAQTEKPRTIVSDEPTVQFQKQTAYQPKQIPPISLYIIIFCTILFITGHMKTSIAERPPEGLPATPLFYSETMKVLSYDYPQSFEMLDQMVKDYGMKRTFNPDTLPPAGKAQMQKFLATPYWDGFYDKVVDLLKGTKDAVTIEAPLFEKIKQGQVWRLITPVFLHYDIFHIFFNMLWLLVLGRQMERNLGVGRYLIFILLTAVFSNSAQYLMSGSAFLGFSGVLCAMIMFVWLRQKNTPWEGYQLPSSTMSFITVFILAMTAIQTFSFFLEINNISPMAPPIANTAHLSGAFAGYVLSKLSFFSRHSK